MPQKQLIQQMDTHLPGWREKFADFDLEPFAAASIGQGNGSFFENFDLMIFFKFLVQIFNFKN